MQDTLKSSGMLRNPLKSSENYGAAAGDRNSTENR